VVSAKPDSEKVVSTVAAVTEGAAVTARRSAAIAQHRNRTPLDMPAL
jgi:hypothetical protein